MHIIGIIFAVLLLLAIIQSTFFFLIVMKVKLIEWIVFNACAPSNITFLIGFVLFLLFKAGLSCTWQSCLCFFSAY